MSFDERKSFAAIKDDLKQNTTDISIVMQKQVLVMQKAQNGVCPATSVR